MKLDLDGYTLKIGYVSKSVKTGLYTEDDVMLRAAAAVDEMRRAGSASAIRYVEVRHFGDWDRDKLTYRCPPRFRVSYDDPVSPA